METGSLYNTGVFRWSDQWLVYNQKSVTERKQLDPKAKQPGYCHYPYIEQYNEAIRINKAGGSSISIQLDSSIDHQEEETPLQLELFPSLVA